MRLRTASEVQGSTAASHLLFINEMKLESLESTSGWKTLSEGGWQSAEWMLSQIKSREMYSLTDGGFPGSAQFGTFQARLSTEY